MTHTLVRAGLLAVLLLPTWLLAQTCETLGTLGTDGTGAPDRYRQGGTYLVVAKEKVAPTSELRIVHQSGPLNYVTLHTRLEGGIWHADYQGSRTVFPGTDPVIEKCRQDTRCTHVIFSLNGAHERYESVVSSAQVELCQAAEPELVLDATLLAPVSGWEIRMPGSWDKSLDDDPQGGTGMVVSADEHVVVGVTTLDYGPDHRFADVLETLRDNMFPRAQVTLDKTFSFAGLTGRQQRYQATLDGDPFAVIAYYLEHTPNRMYVVWALVPQSMAQARMAQAERVMQSFRLLNTAPHTAVALSLGLLEIGTDARVGQEPGSAQTRISATAPELVVATGLTGNEREHPVTLALTRLGNAQPLYRQNRSLSAFAADAPVFFTTTIARPASGWPAGTYRVVVTYGDRELGSRMFTLGDTP